MYKISDVLKHEPNSPNGTDSTVPKKTFGVKPKVNSLRVCFPVAYHSTPTLAALTEFV